MTGEGCVVRPDAREAMPARRRGEPELVAAAVTRGFDAAWDAGHTRLSRDACQVVVAAALRYLVDNRWRP